MRSWVLAAGLMAAAFTTGAKAADLDEGPPPDRYGSAYDDPRYADIYKYPRGPQAYGVPPPGAYRVPYAAAPPPYGVPVPRERVYRDEEDLDPGYGPGPRQVFLRRARRALWWPLCATRAREGASISRRLARFSRRGRARQPRDGPCPPPERAAIRADTRSLQR